MKKVIVDAKLNEVSLLPNGEYEAGFTYKAYDMVEAKDLRIGNWVHALFNDVLIKEIYENKCLVEISSSKREVYDTENISPIPLTPEILEACGFGDGIGETKGFKWNGYNFHLTQDGFLYTDKWYKQNFIAVRYLHQLQNLYFVLTGEELEIKKLANESK